MIQSKEKSAKIANSGIRDIINHKKHQQQMIVSKKSSKLNVSDNNLELQTGLTKLLMQINNKDSHTIVINDIKESGKYKNAIKLTKLRFLRATNKNKFNVTFKETTLGKRIISKLNPLTLQEYNHAYDIGLILGITIAIAGGLASIMLIILNFCTTHNLILNVPIVIIGALAIFSGIPIEISSFKHPEKFVKGKHKVLTVANCAKITKEYLSPRDDKFELKFLRKFSK